MTIVSSLNNKTQHTHVVIFVAKIDSHATLGEVSTPSVQAARDLDRELDKHFGGHGVMDGIRVDVFFNRRQHVFGKNVTFEADVTPRNDDVNEFVDALRNMASVIYGNITTGDVQLIVRKRNGVKSLQTVADVRLQR